MKEQVQELEGRVDRLCQQWGYAGGEFASQLHAEFRVTLDRLAALTPAEPPQQETDGRCAEKHQSGDRCKYDAGHPGLHMTYGLQSWAVHPVAPAEPQTPEPDDRIYPCRECGVLRSKAEGGTTFTVCDECWDRHASPVSSSARPEGLETLLKDLADWSDDQDDEGWVTLRHEALDDLAAALRSLLASHASTEAEAMLVSELENIVNANTKDWDDPSDFKAWAQNRARHTLAAYREQKGRGK